MLISCIDTQHDILTASGSVCKVGGGDLRAALAALSHYPCTAPLIAKIRSGSSLAHGDPNHSEPDPAPLDQGMHYLADHLLLNWTVSYTCYTTARSNSP